MVEKAKKSDMIGAKSADYVRWSFFWLLVLVAVAFNIIYADLDWAIRLSIGLVLLVSFAVILYPTALGQRSWSFIKGARLELRKVSWPTREQTTALTVRVMLVVLLASLILWTLDTFFMWLMSFMATI